MTQWVVELKGDLQYLFYYFFFSEGGGNKKYVKFTFKHHLACTLPCNIVGIKQVCCCLLKY